MISKPEGADKAATPQREDHIIDVLQPQREDHVIDIVMPQREDHVIDTVVTQRDDHPVDIPEPQREDNPVVKPQKNNKPVGTHKSSKASEKLSEDDAFYIMINDIINSKTSEESIPTGTHKTPKNSKKKSFVDYTRKRLDGRYELHKITGKDSIGVNYKAYDNVDHKTVSLKIIKEEYLSDENFRRRFRNQSKAIAVLSHPNIAEVYCVSFGERLSYIVSEYVDGISLKEFIKQKGQLNPGTSSYVAEQILRTLHHAHKKGVFHQNLNSENITLLSDGSIKITDFGIPHPDNYNTVYKKNNIYSVCEILYEMLTGQTFDLPQPQNPRLLNRKIPVALEQILIRGLSHSKDLRYQSAVEMLVDIEAYIRNHNVRFEYSTLWSYPPVMHRKTPTENKKKSRRKKHKSLKTVLGILCVLAAAFIFLVIFGPEIRTAVFGMKYNSTTYNEAVEYAEQGDKANAAIFFSKVADYKDAREKSFALWDEIAVRETVSAGSHHTAILKNDGTVFAVGFNEQRQCSTEDWIEISAVSAGALHTVGLKSDGTVVTVGDNGYNQCDAKEWVDIVAVSAGDYHTVGLRSDGTVVAVGLNDRGQCSVEKWKNVVSVSAGDNHTVALKSDGTVLATGWNDYNQCKVDSWTNIVAVSAGDYNSVGLKSDGTVVIAGESHYGQKDVAAWKNIVAISASDYHLAGIKADGSVVAVGFNEQGQCYVDKWNGITAVSAGGFHTVGLTNDGSVVAIGDNTHGQCNLNGMKNIMLPKENELLISEK